MGIKSRLEQSIRRAQREGRMEDAYDLEQELVALKKQRGDAAWARKHTYVVQPGDSYFSIAGSELGDERWAATLHDANPGLDHLTPGVEIILPQTTGTPSLGSQQDVDALIAELKTPPPATSAGPQLPAQASGDVGTEGQEELPPGVEPPPLTAEEETLVEEVAQELEQLVSLGVLQLQYSPAGTQALGQENLDLNNQPISQASVTATQTASQTPSPSATAHPTQTSTPSPTQTSWPTPTSTPQATASNTITPVPTTTPVDPTAQMFFATLGPDICEEIGECPIKDPTLNWDDPVVHLKWYASGFFTPSLVKLRTSNGMTDLEAMAQIVEEAARIYGDSWDSGILDGLSQVFSGRPSWGVLTLPHEAIRRIGGSPESTLPFGDEGFHDDFRDKQNQVTHFWPYVVSASSDEVLGSLITGFGNIVHEIIQSDKGTVNDYVLSIAGIELGLEIAKNEIKPSELGQELRERLGTNGPGGGHLYDVMLEIYPNLKAVEEP